MADDEKKMVIPTNPLVLPTKGPPRQGETFCPKCRKSDYSGRRVGGVITFTCRACGSVWAGGLPREPVDPRIPLPPENPLSKPSVTFNIDKQGIVHEERRSVQLTQEFRKGAPIPPPGEDDV